MSDSVSGLEEKERRRARYLLVKAAFLALNNRNRVHYTQELKARWEGITDNLKAYRGEYPKHADCSAFATWCIWNGLDHFGIGDTVNGLDWKAGFTGTMLKHGKPVEHLENYLPGDCVIYGSGAPGRHTAIIVGWRDGVPMVISHGSEAGPFYIPWNYRADVMDVRRYI